MHVFRLPDDEQIHQSAIASDIPAGSLVDYDAVATRLGIRRCVVVQPSHFGTDNSTTLAAVRRIGNQARAVVIPPAEAGETDIAALAASGGVAARIFLLRDTGLQTHHLRRIADVVAPFGWHLEVQCHGEQLADVLPLLARLPVPSVIDHLGRMPKGTTADSALFKKLVDYVGSGRGWVKVSAPYHNSRGRSRGFEDLRSQIEALAKAAPERLVWATNWPHVTFDEKPDDLGMALELLSLLPDSALVQRVLVDNPERLYRFS